MIAVRSFHGVRSGGAYVPGQANSSTKLRCDRRAGIRGLSRQARFYYRFRRVAPRGSAVRAWSVRQSFHAFGNDLAELHHLLAQSRVIHDVAMDAFAVRTQLFTQVA